MLAIHKLDVCLPKKLQMMWCTYLPFFWCVTVKKPYEQPQKQKWQLHTEKRRKQGSRTETESAESQNEKKPQMTVPTRTVAAGRVHRLSQVDTNKMTRLNAKAHYLGTVVIHAGQDVVHEVKLLARSVRQNEASTHDGDLCMLNLYQTRG